MAEEINFEKTIEDNLSKILKNIKNDKQKKTATIAVALSGGSDSLAITIALHELNYNVFAILVNHNLRIEAKNEIQQTIKTIGKYNIKYIVQEWDGKVKNNLENEARQARYKLLLDVCKEHNVKYLCLGHHMDDQIETFLLNLARGSGLDGLCCMPKTMILENIHIIRPMLNLTKQDCVNYLTSKHLTWCEDDSNKDIQYKRNHIRYLLGEIEDKVLLTKRINTTITILQEVRETMDVLINQTANNIASYKYNENNNIQSVTFSKDILLNLTLYLQKSLLTKFIMQISCKTYKPRLYQIENIISDIRNHEHFKRTIASCIIYSKNNNITISMLSML